jgi:hypothetical protein
MRRMNTRLTALACAVCIALMAVPAKGWEFEMTGSMNWAYEFYNQLGPNGFFGPYDVDLGIGTTTANLNYWWNGARLAQNLVTGKDGSRSYFYVFLDPTLKINEAVRLKGRMRLGQWGNPQAGYYYVMDAPGTDNAFSEAQFTMFWASAALPWGTFGIGKRPWKFGTGLQYDGSDGLSTESMLLNAPYGPLDIGFGIYVHRPARPSPTIIIDPYDLVAAPYFNHSDTSGAFIADMDAYVMYNSGVLQAGILGAYGKYHIGPEGAFYTGRAQATPLAQDSYYFHGTVFTKYNNGRFFFNTEAAWVYWRDQLSGPAAVGLVNPRDTEQWRYMAELGTVCGPGKVALLFAWSPGSDRRDYALIGKQSALFVYHPTFDTFLGNFDVFRPYSFIFSYNYGSGFNAYNLSLDGYVRDAMVLATRFDYAVAANLNVFGTFFYAERTSNGYGWACISPNDGFMPPQFVATANDGNVQFAINGAAGSPNIPDRSLGYEIDGGFDWQLLDGWTVGLLVGYWQPGKWFNYACIDRSVPGWNVPGPGNFWGTRPDKKIDPILGGQFTMNFAF